MTINSFSAPIGTNSFGFTGAGTSYATKIIGDNVITSSNLSVTASATFGSSASDTITFKGGTLSAPNNLNIMSGVWNMTSTNIYANQDIVSTANMHLTSATSTLEVGTNTFNNAVGKIVAIGDNGALTNMPLVYLQGSVNRNNDYINIKSAGGSTVLFRVDKFGNVIGNGTGTISNLTFNVAVGMIVGNLFYGTDFISNTVTGATLQIK
jgi:hypothetical protein